jgi:UDP-glucose 4-epimerase
MRIVITGASGNIGTALLRRLSAGGEHDLVGVARRAPGSAAPYDAASWHAVDVGSPEATDALTEVLREADAVVHLAWLIQPSHDRELLRRVNQGGTRAVLEATRRAGVPHLVHLSSIGAYATADGRWVDESWPTTGIPTSSYSVDKAACERLLDAVSDELAVARVRPTVVLQETAASEVSRLFLGPFVPPALIRPRLLRLTPWPRELAVQFVHADDVADALERILRSRATGAFNLAAEPVIDSDGFRATFGGVAPPAPPGALRALVDLSWRARLQPTDPGWVDMALHSPLLLTDRARELGWVPRRMSTEALRSFVEALHRRSGGSGPVLHRRGRLHLAG